MSSAVVLNLTLTLDRLGWLAQRDDLNSYYEDRLVGLAVAHDARPIRLTYLNTHDHFDHPSGMPFVRAASGQPALLYEHEGPGGLLVSHHVRTAAAFAAAIDAQRPAVQAARAFSLECAPFAAAAAAERERMPAAVGAERAGGFPRELRGWRVCAPTFEYSLGSPNLGHCGATAGEGDCAAGERGAEHDGEGHRQPRRVQGAVQSVRPLPLPLVLGIPRGLQLVPSVRARAAESAVGGV